MLIFVLIISSVLGSIWLYVWERLVETSHLSPDARAAVLFVFVGSYIIQLYRWVAYDRADERPRVLMTAYFLLGLMVHLFFATLIKDILLSLLFLFKPSIWS